jgi:hypothetical protein
MKRLIPLLILSSSAVIAAEAQLQAWTAVQGTTSSGNATAVVSPFFGPMTPKSPAAQRYLKWQNRGMVLRQNEGLAEALRLTPQEVEKLYDLLADQMTRMRTAPRMALNDIDAMRKQAEEIKARDDAEIAKVIGQNRMPLWKDFQETLIFRAQAQNVRDQLQMMGVPLSDDQRQQLLDMFLQDRQLPYGPPPDQNASISVEERIAQSNKWQDENDRKQLERMKPVLTAEQYSRYSDYQAYMAEMRTNFQSFRQSAQGNGTVSGVIGGGVVQQGVIQQGTGGNSIQFRSLSMPGQMVAPAQVPAAPAVPASPPADPASK